MSQRSLKALIRQYLMPLVLITVTVCGLISAARAASVIDARVWRAPDHTRLVLDLTDSVKHNIFLVSNPDRLVVDLTSSSLTNAGVLSKLDLSKLPIKHIRYANKDNKDLRIVLDLSAPVKPKSFLLRADKKLKDRLVIDLYDKSTVKPQVKQANVDGRRDIVVAIDAGHGGEDPGAIGAGRVQEKHVVLAIAKQLKKLLEQQPGYKPYLTRSGDYYIGLSQRPALARKQHADMFISIHADSFTNPRARGASVFALSQRGSTSVMAKHLADRENRADLVGGLTLADKGDVLASVLLDLSMTASLDASIKVGNEVLKNMSAFAHLHSKRVEQAGFAVLKSADIPSILIETGFISNPGEAKKLSSRSYQQKMAKAIFQGVNSYFQAYPPSGTLLAAQKNGQPRQYTVVSGDTLSAIAQRYRVSQNALKQYNQLQNTAIWVGQRLKIPAS